MITRAAISDWYTHSRSQTYDTQNERDIWTRGLIASGASLLQLTTQTMGYCQEMASDKGLDKLPIKESTLHNSSWARYGRQFLDLRDYSLKFTIYFHTVYDRQYTNTNTLRYLHNTSRCRWRYYVWYRLRWDHCWRRLWSRSSDHI